MRLSKNKREVSIPYFEQCKNKPNNRVVHKCDRENIVQKPKLFIIIELEI